MPPSLSAIERGNPPPRRKSCAGCIKAKRRCDLRQPSCLRCTQRKIACSYPKHLEATSRAKSSSNVNGNGSRSNDDASSLFQTESIGTSTAILPQDLLKDTQHQEVVSWETNFHFSMDMGPSYQESCAQFPTLSFNEPMGPAFPELDFLDDMMNVNMSNAMDLMPPPPPPPPPAVPTPDPMPVAVRPPAPRFGSGSAAVRVQLLQAISELVAKRLQYLLDLFKGAPEKMALEGTTVWCHPALYKDSMPAFLEDAVSSCALYRAKNKLNEALIQRIIETRYQKLLATPTTSSSSSSSSSSTSSGREMMARTQALLLYQIMLSFDESATARAMAEESFSVLADAAGSLKQFVTEEVEDDEDEDITSTSTSSNSNSNSKWNNPLSPPTTARALLADFAYRESMRRTMLMGMLFVQLQYMLRADFSSSFCEIPPPPSSPCPSSTSSSTPSLNNTSSSPFSPSTPFSNLSSDVSTVAAIQRAISEPPYRAATNATKNNNQDTDKEKETEQLKCDSRFLLCGTLTLSSHLWSARDAVQFALAWRSKRHFVATPWNAIRRLETGGAAPDDLDEMARLLMTTMMGIEEAGAWFAARGGIL